MQDEEPNYRRRRNAVQLEQRQLRQLETQQRTDRWKNWREILTSALAVISAGIALTSIWVAVDNAATAQRPWLSVSPEIQKPLSFVSTPGNKAISILVDYKLSVLGPAPARNVTVAHAIVPHPGGASTTSLDSSLAKLCEEAEKNSNIDKIGGPAVFPGQIRSIERAAGSEPIYKADEPVLFSVQGCADYTFGDGRHGKTAFRMLLGHAGPVFWEGLRFQPSPSPDGKIALGKTTLNRAQFDFKEDPSGGNYLR